MDHSAMEQRWAFPGSGWWLEAWIQVVLEPSLRSPYDLPFDTAISDDLCKDLISSRYVARTVHHVVGVDESQIFARTDLNNGVHLRRDDIVSKPTRLS